MKASWPRPGRMPYSAPLVAVCFAVVALATPPTATAVPTLFGGQLYYTGGDVSIDVIDNNTAFDEVLQLRTALEVLDVVDGSQNGSRVTLTAQQLADMGIGVGDELRFGIHVRNTDQDFFLGPGSGNADGLDHAYVRSSRADAYIVGFEDLLNGGDRDYNDMVFRFSGGTTIDNPRIAVAEPTSLLLLLMGLGLLGGRRRSA